MIKKYEEDPLLSHREEYLKIGLSVDNVVLSFGNDGIRVLLMECNTEPYEGKWSLLGDWVHPEESLEEAAGRILEKRTGITDIYHEQIHAFGDIDRHPMARVITISYLILLKDDDLPKVRRDERLIWMKIEDIEDLAFDHNVILKTALSKLKTRLDSFRFAQHLLPTYFTLSQLQDLYECVYKTEYDRRNFRKKAIESGCLLKSEKLQKNVKHRPAQLYTIQ